jgi:hypothetical protein
MDLGAVADVKWRFRKLAPMSAAVDVMISTFRWSMLNSA